MSVQRAPASSAASAPGPSALLIASWRAAPFGYASLILDCQLAAAMERRPRARAIQMITPMRTRAPRTTHSQMSGELDPLAATGEPLGRAPGAGAGGALWTTAGWGGGPRAPRAGHEDINAQGQDPRWEQQLHPGGDTDADQKH